MSICLPLLSLDDAADPAAAGRFIFNCLVASAFLLSCGACLLTSDVLSSERREGTLGLLFLSRLTPFELLLGKLGSAGFSGLCALVAFLPILMLPVLMGGVTGGEVVRNALVLFDTLFLALAAGLWASARAEESFSAARKAVVLMVLLVLLPALPEGVFRAVGNSTSGVGLFSPLITLFDADDAGYHSALMRYCLSLVLVQATAWLLLRNAAVRLQKSLCEEPEHGSGMGHAATMGSIAALPRRLKPLGGANPVEWLVGQQPEVRRTIWAAGIISTLYSTLAWFFHRIVGFPAPDWYALLMWPAGLIVSLTNEGLLARAASRFFYEAKRSGQLELLLTTPCGAQTIVSGQWRALLRLLRWPIGLSLAVGLVSLTSTLASGPEALTDSGFFWTVQYPLTVLLGLAVPICSIGTVCWLGMWFGLRGHSPLATMFRAAGLTTGVPFLFRTFVTIGLSAITYRLAGGGWWTRMGLAWLQAVVILAYLFWLMRRVRRRLAVELGENVVAHRTVLFPDPGRRQDYVGERTEETESLGKESI
jgi:hypothetical protein